MKEEALVKAIIKRHGEVINLKDDPSVMIEILRRFSLTLDDGGAPGGAPPAPPPGPTSHQGEVSNEELMKEVLKLSRSIAQLKKQLARP